MQELAKHYQPQEVEARLYKQWEEQNLFAPDAGRNDTGEKFSIVIPPPNVTGTLHIGHALDNTLQDILIRWHRMLGDNTLWMPGTDHAGIATQSLVERQLRAQDNPVSRFDLGREKFIDKVWDWARYSEAEILGQFRRLGISPDWSRKRFTLDDGCSLAVRTAFKQLYDAGLIYRGDYIVNWSPGCQSAISDIETEYSDEESFLWHIFYPLSDDPNEGVVVATTRPETLYGDVAVAVHPDDDRYQHIIGKTVRLPISNVDIPVITDSYVEKDFGTGALKITPAHDPNDFEVSKRHNLAPVLIMSEKAELMNAERVPADLIGVERFEARKITENKLSELGLLRNKEPHIHRVGRCQRSGSIVEPLLSKQWFVSTKPLAEKCLKALDAGELRFVPERWTKTYTDWMENIRDWCISRQLWWGHQIPAWYCNDCLEITVDIDTPKNCSKCSSSKLAQDGDVLDTWFSSGLWPFSTMGWPNAEAPDLKTYYPTDVLVTGFDIIFFWVARMTMFAHQLTGKSPFKTVYIHGLVRDEHGQKMSKSKGNVIDPVKIIDDVGCDAMRFSLVGLVTYGGQDIKLSEERFEQGKLYCNKLWNASRFVLMNLDGVDDAPPEFESLDVMSQWMLTSLAKLVEETNSNLQAFRTGEAAQGLYQATWNQFCDWYVEAAKLGLRDEASKLNTQRVLLYCLKTILKLHHPFMPFITEEIWQKLPHTQGSISLAAYPLANDPLLVQAQTAHQAFEIVEELIDIIKVVRNIRQSNNFPLSEALTVHYSPASQADFDALHTAGLSILQHFLKLQSFEYLATTSEQPENTLAGLIGSHRLFIEIPHVETTPEELARQRNKLDKLLAEKQGLEGRLNNPGFVDKAPAAVVVKDRERLDELTSQIAALETQLQLLS